VRRGITHNSPDPGHGGAARGVGEEPSEVGKEVDFGRNMTHIRLWGSGEV
jgi:hypothetical protein